MIEYVRPMELAKELGVTKAYIYMLIRLGEIPAKKKAGYWLITQSAANQIKAKWTPRGNQKLHDKRFKLLRTA